MLLVFLPITLIGYYLLSRTHRLAEIWLAGASIVFYAVWSVPFTLLLISSIGFNYLCGLAILRQKPDSAAREWTLAAGVAVNLLLLIYYKYLFPFLAWLSGLGLIGAGDHSVILPLGISFFTFTQIGYLVDCKSGIVKTRNLIDYLLFVTFFPHLIAGPILHHREMMPQFTNPNTYRFNPENLAVGGTLFVFGLFKKTIIADSIAPLVKLIFAEPDHAGFMVAWIGVLCYSVQLYFDFSGYTDMAIGLARMFGLRFPANFNSPYKATNIIDFWQRWHMTLTRYLTLYLYTPIALRITRSRAARGKSFGRSATATLGGFLHMVALPTTFTMVLAGVWHGAGLQFLVWGLLHALYLTVNHAWRIFGPKLGTASIWRHRFYLLLFWALTYLAVVIAQVMFRANSAADAVSLYAGMLGLHQPVLTLTPSLIVAKAYTFVVLGYLIALFMPNAMQIMARYSPVLGNLRLECPPRWTWRPNYVWAACAGGLAIVAFINLSAASEFLYFQF
jgi:D-alanyl-lipoteichoic acid acyltransferase DltB (MBOAT superfamily)